jgi:hypothetical protein
MVLEITKRCLCTFQCVAAPSLRENYYKLIHHHKQGSDCTKRQREWLEGVGFITIQLMRRLRKEREEKHYKLVRF